MRSTLGIVHVHSVYSHDGRDTLRDLAEFAAVRDIGFIGLTEHAEDFRQCDGTNTSARATRPRTLPSIDTRARGSLRRIPRTALAGLRPRTLDEPTTPDAFITLAGPASSLTGLAHPILAGYDIPAAVRGGIDAVEVWNATYNTRYLPDPRAFRLLHKAARPARGRRSPARINTTAAMIARYGSRCAPPTPPIR